MTPGVGTVLGRYRLLEQVGAGGMGTVFRALDEHLGRNVAIKVMSADMFGDADAKRRFREEAHALSQLNHSNIQTLYDFDSQRNIDFLVVEFVPGISLDQLTSTGALPAAEVVNLGKQLASALISAHDKNIIHRDLKLANLRLRPDGQLKVLDFGLAKIVPQEPSAAETTSIKSNGVVGTIPYMAPEVLRGKPANPVSDLYSAGVILYELATGLSPHRESGATLIEAILNRVPATPRALDPSISPGLEQVILKAIEKRPEYRYQTARDLLVDLQRLEMPVSQSSVQSPATASKSLLPWLAVVVSALLAVGVWVYRAAQVRTVLLPKTIQSLAVLPLKNLSGDPTQQYFSEAMTEELTSELTSLRSLRVISRTSANRYTSTTKSLPEIARELNVDAIMEGSVLRDGNTIRISLQLVDAVTDRQVWSEKYERSTDNVMAVQREVARAVAQRIHLKTTPAEERHLQTVGTQNPLAYEAYLRATYKLRSQSREEDTDAAIEQSELAIKLDPGFAAAYVTLARGCSNKIFFWNAGKEFDEKAFVAVNRALALDPGLAEAYLVRGSLYYNHLHNFDLAGAISDSQAALALSPNSSSAHHAFGSDLAHLGLHDQAVIELQTAIRLDPLSEGAKRRLGRALWQSNRFLEALDIYRKYNQSNFEKVAVLTYLGRHQEAWTLLGQSPAPPTSGEGRSVQQSDFDAATALLFAKEGKQKEAQDKILTAARLGKGQDHFHHAAFLIAAAHAEMGNKHEALTWLRFVADHGMPNYPLLRHNPSMGKLHGNPEYERFMEELEVRWKQIADGVSKNPNDSATPQNTSHQDGVRR